MYLAETYPGVQVLYSNASNATRALPGSRPFRLIERKGTVIAVYDENNIDILFDDARDRVERTGLGRLTIISAPPLSAEEHYKRLGGDHRQWKGASAIRLARVLKLHPEWGLKLTRSGELKIEEITELL